MFTGEDLIYERLVRGKVKVQGSYAAVAEAWENCVAVAEEQGGDHDGKNIQWYWLSLQGAGYRQVFDA